MNNFLWKEKKCTFSIIRICHRRSSFISEDRLEKFFEREQWRRSERTSLNATPRAAQGQRATALSSFTRWCLEKRRRPSVTESEKQPPKTLVEPLFFWRLHLSFPINVSLQQKQLFVWSRNARLGQCCHAAHNQFWFYLIPFTSSSRCITSKHGGKTASPFSLLNSKRNQIVLIGSILIIYLKTNKANETKQQESGSVVPP